jgi:UTP:GlnB (protein PII) uridylyltransferase
VVDAFYLTDAEGKPLSQAHRERVESALIEALAG